MPRALPLCLILLLPAIAFGQPASDQAAEDGEGPAPKREAIPDAGFWPTNRMIELAMIRFVEDAKVRLDLDVEQQQAFEKALIDRWVPFLKEHRPVLQRLLNEYVEARMAGTPPPRETVQRWANEALPILRAARKEMEDNHEELADLLRPDQQAKLDAERVKFGLGYQVAEAKLEDWKEGRFREEEWGGGSRRAREAPAPEPPAVASATEEADPEGFDEPGRYVPPNRWQAYLRRFARTYDLDGAQMTAAQSILEEMEERSGSYEETHRREFETIEAKFKVATGPTKEQLQAEQEHLRQPLVDMFDEYKKRLHALLTAEQRQRASKPEPPKPKPAEPAEIEEPAPAEPQEIEEPVPAKPAEIEEPAPANEEPAETN
jgi:hypothetical protein